MHSVRVGVFATDQSYWQFYVEYKGLNVSLSVTGGNGTLRATPTWETLTRSCDKIDILSLGAAA